MRDYLFYFGGAALLIASVGLFYGALSNLNENKGLIVGDNINQEKTQEIVKNPPKWPVIKDSNNSKKIKESAKEKKVVTQDKNISQKKNLRVKNENLNKKSLDDENDAALPDEIVEIKNELEDIKNETQDLIAQAESLNMHMEADFEKIKPDIQKAEEITEELKDEGVVDVEKIEEETRELLKPIAIEKAPVEVKEDLLKADKSRYELEKALTRLKILEEGEN